MLKRTLTALMTLAAMFCFTIAGEASQNNNWLIYWYICGSNLEWNLNLATKDIAEMQHVKLPPNMKVLIYASGVPSTEDGQTQWHHPTIKAGGDGIYLYSSNRLEKVADFNENMSDPATLVEFLKFGEENFKADHRMMYFWNHGSLGGVCYDDRFDKDGLTYNELSQAFASVYGTSPESKPFELMFFNACLTGSYELANSVSNFSHYMLGAEPSIYDTPTRDWVAALAKNPSMTGAQIGKVICDSAMKNFSDNMRTTHIFSVIDLDKMPQLRTAYEAYFDEALNRSDEKGFLGSFSRAIQARNVDKYSNCYLDLGLLAKNTKSIMPKTSSDLLTAIDNAVVYKKRGEYLKSLGISTYHPYTSTDGDLSTNYRPQIELYNKLGSMNDMSAFTGNNSVFIEKDSNNHLVATLTPEQLANVSSVYSFLIPVKENFTAELGGFEIGGAILSSADNFKVDWKKGTVTEDYRPVEPMFDGNRFIPQLNIRSHKNTLYKVPIIYQPPRDTSYYRRDLIVSYNTSKNTYSIIGFGSDLENGSVRDFDENTGKVEPGSIITSLQLILSDNDADAVKPVKDSDWFNMSDKRYCWKWVKGNPFVYTKDSTITNSPITKGHYLYFLVFVSPSGQEVVSMFSAISVDKGKITRYGTSDLMAIWQMK